MDRGKSSAGRGGKGKTQQYPSDIFALGSKSSRPEPAESKRTGGLPGKSGSSHSVSGAGDRKREGPPGSVVPSSLAPKKAKLASKGAPPPGEAWEMVASSDWDTGTGGAELAPLVLEAADADEADRVVGLLCGAIRHLRAGQRSKASATAGSSSATGVGISPSSQQDIVLYISLLYLGKVRPSLFAVDVVCHALCSLLRKDPHAGGPSVVGSGVPPGLPPFKVKTNPSVPILAANLLLRGFQEKKTWPDTFLKLYVEDSIGDRVWVDTEECRAFVDNILTAIDTKATPLHSRPLLGPGMAPPDPMSLTLPLGRTEGCSSPSTVGQDDEMGMLPEGGEVSGAGGTAGIGDGIKEKVDIPVSPRYANSQEAVEQIVMDAVREQLNRRQPPENITRNFLRLLTSSAGLVEVRLTAASRLEMWLQNPKLTRPAQELLLSVCTNCSSHTQRDVEVISHLVKIRLKTKALIHLYLGGIRELITAHPDNLMTVLKHTIYNELSTARNPNNMAMIGVIFQAAPEKAATLLAEIFQDLLMNREDYHRPLRALLREVVRFLRHDVDLGALARGLMKERTPPPTLATPSGEIEHRERMFVAVVDLVAMCVFLAVSPNVREAANLIARGDRREVKVIQCKLPDVAKLFRCKLPKFRGMQFGGFMKLFLECIDLVLQSLFMLSIR
ncbi:hypothetical protein J437_LFUL001933 [Ladona fulva]|uniref:Integrator complex subunit 1 RPB2-binding domain-containing protein n=1 Tax=Ladona fulva TaxID=123851 RepID=A0A8K0NXK9_LADFU|nr:hypothetical protein J437_LFUL001933 [Ladona fulva]